MQNENGVLAVQEDFGNTLVDKYAPVWDKKYRSKGESIWVFQRRTLSSACQVATTLHDMDFGKASTFLFHLVREAEECKPIIEAVSSQVELAMANPDKFIKGYHQFLQGLTKPIKKNKDYALYFKAIAYAQECVHSGLSIDGNVERNDSVLYAVIDMLMQGSEYLKPQEFDIVNNIVGISTENEPIIIRDPYPLAMFLSIIVMLFSTIGHTTNVNLRFLKTDAWIWSFRTISVMVMRTLPTSTASTTSLCSHICIRTQSFRWLPM